jgi:hypothetical protein
MVWKEFGHFGISRSMFCCAVGWVLATSACSRWWKVNLANCLLALERQPRGSRLVQHSACHLLSLRCWSARISYRTCARQLNKTSLGSRRTTAVAAGNSWEPGSAILVLAGSVLRLSYDSFKFGWRINIATRRDQSRGQSHIAEPLWE